jgi:hypothetical protein
MTRAPNRSPDPGINHLNPAAALLALALALAVLELTLALEDAVLLLALDGAKVELMLTLVDVEALVLVAGRVMVTFGNVTGAEVADAHCSIYAGSREFNAFLERSVRLTVYQGLIARASLFRRGKGQSAFQALRLGTSARRHSSTT